MSVINQMLRDLDSRAAGEKERNGLPQHLRNLPPTSQVRQRDWPTLVVGIVVGAVIAGGLVGWLMHGEAPAPVPPAAALPEPVSQPAPALTADNSVPSASTIEGGGDKANLPIDLGEMKLSMLLSLAQQPLPEKPVSQPKPATNVAPLSPAPPPVTSVASQTAAPVVTKSAESVKPSITTPPAPPKIAEPPKPATTVANETQIDKRPKSGMSSDLAEAEYRKGMQAVKRGDGAAGITAFRSALEMDPALAKARQALLSVLVGARQWAEAQRVAQAGLALDPAQSGWAMILARLQFEQGDTTGSLDTLARHAAYATGDADYQGLHAYLLQKQQRPAEAVDRFKAALALRPGEGRWWFGLGLSLENAGRAVEARDAYVKARDSGNLPNDMVAAVEQKLK